MFAKKKKKTEQQSVFHLPQLCLQHHKLLSCGLAPFTQANGGAEVVTFTEASLHIRAKDKKLCACVATAVIKWGMFAKGVILNRPL